MGLGGPGQISLSDLAGHARPSVRNHSGQSDPATLSDFIQDREWISIIGLSDRVNPDTIEFTAG